LVKAARSARLSAVHDGAAASAVKAAARRFSKKAAQKLRKKIMQFCFGAGMILL